MRNHFEEGWYYGYSPKDDIDGEGRPIKIDTRAIVGRFRDVDIIDGAASRKVGRSTYKPGTILETRRAGGGSSDISVVPIRFNRMYRNASIAAIERFPEAWVAYQEVRVTPITKEEREELSLNNIDIIEPKTEVRVVADEEIQKPRRGRKPKIAKNVVPIVPLSASAS